MRSHPSLHARAAAIRSRALVRGWEMRQLDRAAGVWFRLGRLLALSRSAWALSESDAERLVAAGYSPHPVGLELEPPRRLFVIAVEQLASLASAREVPLRASVEILGCRILALVPFEGLDVAEYGFDPLLPRGEAVSNELIDRLREEDPE